MDEGEDILNFFRAHLSQDLLKNFVKGSSHDEIKLKGIIDSVTHHLYKNNDVEMQENSTKLTESKLISSESMQQKKQAMIAKMKAKQ